MNGPLPLFPNDALIHLRIHALYELMGNDNNKILQFVIVTVVGFVCNSRLFKEKVDKEKYPQAKQEYRFEFQNIRSIKSDS